MVTVTYTQNCRTVGLRVLIATHLTCSLLYKLIHQMSPLLGAILIHRCCIHRGNKQELSYRKQTARQLHKH